MGILGESKQDIINKYEKSLIEKDKIILSLRDENEKLKSQTIEYEKKINDITKTQNIKNDSNSTNGLILGPGNYMGSLHIPVGTYNLIAEFGSGKVRIKNPDIIVSLTTNKKYTNEYDGIQINDKTSLDISNGLKVKFVYSIGSKNDNQESKQEMESNKKDELILHAGKYRGGVNIPVGIYDLTIISGTGIISSENPEHIFERLESDPEICKKNNWSSSYNGFEVSDKTIFKIDQSAKIKFILSKKIDLDIEFEKYLYRKKEIEKEIDYLEQIKNSKKQEIGNIILLGNGTYYGGKTIPCGIYDLHIPSGTALIETKNPKKYFYIGKSRGYNDSYIGLEINNSTILNITSDKKIEFMLTIKYDDLFGPENDDEIIDKQKIIIKLDEKIKFLNEKKKSTEELLNQKNIDISNRKKELQKIEYDIKRAKEINDKENKKLSDIKDKIKSHLDSETQKLNEIKSKQQRQVDGMKKIFDDVKKLNEEKRKLELEIKTINIDIENSKRQLSEINENIDDAQNLAKNKYNEEKRKLDIEFSDTYAKYCERYNKIKSEIETVKGELKILNNAAVERYYIFSDYDSMTSEECKNELLLLKSEEKELRSTETDIKILTIKTDHKITERSIRQLLRKFNSECDNIMRNIGLKNIDVVRNKIQKSFESLNKLYSFDGVNLSNNILQIKLKQASLMYTYELKYQQEKDIQKAIREQMVEEARAEREIQEQKKKIEKDLQQHLGEVNRLMKYMQKTQADVERQMYMDKIKELEEKIKTLESDKETVLEREANATAGFVYIISNIGSFGEDIYKIGMTRRLDPMERIYELSSASVPFEFDVHAMIFSSDAPDLENTLHKHFADKAVNKVNPRKEFYKVDIDEIEQVVKQNYNDTVQFTKIPVAAEYRQSIEL